MKTFHITYFINRGEDSESTPLLGAITIQSESITYALVEYVIMSMKENTKLPSSNEIKYIIEL